MRGGSDAGRTRSGSCCGRGGGRAWKAVVARRRKDLRVLNGRMAGSRRGHGQNGRSGRQAGSGAVVGRRGENIAELGAAVDGALHAGDRQLALVDGRGQRGGRQRGKEVEIRIIVFRQGLVVFDVVVELLTRTGLQRGWLVTLLLRLLLQSQHGLLAIVERLSVVAAATTAGVVIVGMVWVSIDGREFSRGR